MAVGPLRRAKRMLTSERRSPVVRNLANRVVRAVYRRRARRAAMRPGAASAASAVRAFETFYDGPETADFVERWSLAHPDRIDTHYFKTHAGRYAFMIEVVRHLGVTGDCLDVGGIETTKEIFEEQTRVRAVSLSPDVDLEMDEWAEQAGVNRFELCIFSEVIEHFNADPARALHEINRCLVDGGYLLLTTVNVGSELGLYYLAHGHAPYAMANISGTRRSRHEREYAPKELQILVAAHGFETWVTTANVYGTAAVKRKARQWVTTHLPLPSPQLHGDTNIVIGRKIAESDHPRWIHPVYHESVSENRRDQVPEDVAARLRDGAPPGLAELFAVHTAN